MGHQIVVTLGVVMLQNNLVYKNESRRILGDGSGGKGLSVKPWGAEFQPQKPYRKPDVSTCFSDLSAEEEDTGGHLGFANQSV